MNKKVIITGITGQDGSYMADYLLENTKHNIYGVVRRASTNNYRNIEHILCNPRFKILTADLSDSQSIDNIIREVSPNYFINFAAQSFVAASWQIPEQTFDVDAMGVVRCLEAIRKHAPQCRFYNAGSSEELGDVDYSPQNEAHPLKPRSPYGAAKAAARHIVKVYRESYNLYAIQGLLYNHESPRRGEEFVTRKITKAVSRIGRSLREGMDFTPLELGNIDAMRDWSHAKDFVRGIWMMLNQDTNYVLNLAKRDGKASMIESHNLPKYIKEYLLASGNTYTIRYFVILAFGYAGIKGSWQISDSNESISAQKLETFVKDTGEVLAKINPEFYRPADVELLLGDSSMARDELGWAPSITFEELVKEMVMFDIINM